jgi:hypothetical protein
VAAVAALAADDDGAGVVGSAVETAASTLPDSIAHDCVGSAIRLVAALHTAAITMTSKINVTGRPPIFTAPRMKLPVECLVIVSRA